MNSSAMLPTESSIKPTVTTETWAPRPDPVDIVSTYREAVPEPLAVPTIQSTQAGSAEGATLPSWAWGLGALALLWLFTRRGNR